MVDEQLPQKAQESQKGRTLPFAFLEFFAAPLLSGFSLSLWSLVHDLPVYGQVGNVTHAEPIDLNRVHSTEAKLLPSPFPPAKVAAPQVTLRILPIMLRLPIAQIPRRWVSGSPAAIKECLSGEGAWAESGVPSCSKPLC